MPKVDLGAQLKKRMAATQQASDLQMGDEVYEKVFQMKAPEKQPSIRNIPMEHLRPFYTADIGFKPYPPDKLKAFAAQLDEEGVFERIIVRPIPCSDDFEIIAGHNRTAAGRLNGWAEMPAEVIEADDARATAIAIATNLMRRQGLSIMERGKAYKALLSAKTRQGFRSDLLDVTSGESRLKLENADEETSGEIRPKFSARALVADFFGVTEYEIRKAIKLTQLIPALQDIVDDDPKHLNLACADLIADYDADTQNAFVSMCNIEGYWLNASTVKFIRSKCPPPSAKPMDVQTAWNMAREKEEQQLTEPPKKISFDRKRFAPYLNGIRNDKELEDLFLEFLRSRKM